MEQRVTLTLSIQPLEDDRETLSLVPILSGMSFIDLVGAFEQTHGFEPAGGYGGIVPDWFRYGPLEEYFIGASKDEFWDKGCYLLGCRCGEVGCWPFRGRITLNDKNVIWHSFAQPHRPRWDYADFGPFIFDIEAYKSAVREAARNFQK